MPAMSDAKKGDSRIKRTKPMVSAQHMQTFKTEDKGLITIEILIGLCGNVKKML